MPSHVHNIINSTKNNKHTQHTQKITDFTTLLSLGMLPVGRFKNTNELLNSRALKFSPVNKIHIFQRMGKIFWVEFQR